VPCRSRLLPIIAMADPAHDQRVTAAEVKQTTAGSSSIFEDVGG
jgi:hypothetical protein